MRVFKKRVLLRNQPWMNKKRRRERSCRDERSQLNHIPLDLALDILSRLPAKLLVRSLYVSKLWSSSITLPSFINSFTSRSTSRSPTLMVTLSSESAKYVLFFPTHQKADGSFYSPLYSYEITNLDWQDWRSASIQGLILTPVFKIWNPTLRRFIALQHPPGKHSSSRCWWSYLGWASYLGYDPLESKHKVLCVLSKKYLGQPRVLTLGGQESWRIIPKGRCPVHRPTRGYGRCFNGILYYRARILGDGHDIIMSFDVKSEHFNIIKLPEGPTRQFHMIPYEGSLALVVTYRCNVVILFILKDAHGHEWARSVLHVPCESDLWYSLHFKGITDAGELIFASYSFRDVGYILYFDPRKNSARKFLFERNLDDFRRRCGLDSKHTFVMQVFPNHIESLFSL